jgi:dTDP-D-glucose 4,6-dehydratase
MFNEHVINDTYNIGSNIEYKNLEIIGMIQDILPGKEANVEFVPDRLGHDRVYRLNLNKLRTYFAGFDIAKSFLHIKDYLIGVYGGQ